MKTQSKSSLILLLLLALVSLPAKASPMAYNWEYQFSSGATFSGMLVGELRDDLDIIDVSSVSQLSLSTDPAFTFITGIQEGLYVSLSGQHANIGANSDNDFPIQWALISESAGAGLPGPFRSLAIISNPGLTTLRDPYEPDNWRIAAKPIPSPATLYLICSALLTLRLGKRK